MKTRRNKSIGIVFFGILLVMLIFNSCGEYNKVYAIDKSKCSLCQQCISVCGNHAISYIDTGDTTTDYIVIDSKKCVGCGKCIKACSSKAIYSAD